MREVSPFGIHAIRFYEREGLVKKPIRSEGSYRLFDRDGVSDLKFIRGARELSFSLNEIRALLGLCRTRSEECFRVRDLLRQKLGRVEEKIKDSIRLESELKAALRKCNRDSKRSGDRVEKSCPVLEELGRWNGDRRA